MNRAAPIIEFSKVALSFGAQPVHRDLNFSLHPGEITTLLGPSGAGKTLILKLVAGLLFASEGTVTVMGQDMNNLNESDLRSVRGHIGMLFQGAALFDSLNVSENIVYGLRERGERDEGRLRLIVEQKLEMVGLSGIQNKLPSQLSGGQRKRIGLARALATSPKIMLYDEPTTGLDPTSTRMIDELIIKFRDKHGIASLVVTHDIQSARRISDRWMLLNRGAIVADGPPAIISSKHQLVSDFVNGTWKDDE
jgi:phospholipid/cholesterol/gamma-HCH transport system ATP-binding protein